MSEQLEALRHIKKALHKLLRVFYDRERHKVRDAGAMVGQGGRRGMQGHSRPMRREASLKLGGSGILPWKIFCGHIPLIGMLSRIF